MPAPTNGFKSGLRSGEAQIGLWLGLADPTSAELCGGAGFDWLLIDGEHGPNDIPLIAAQLRALSGSPSHAVVRPSVGDAALIKQLLDIGAQTILVPMVERAAEARELVRAVRYPPDGIRGVGAALARASGYGRVTDYLTTANDQICLLLQVESKAGFDNIEEIAGVEGVDGVFIGPADLAADLGYLGNPSHPEVQKIVEAAIERVLRVGKAAGILTSARPLAHRYLELGASFVAVGSDVGLLAGATTALMAVFRPGDRTP